ncbi:glycerate kinase [Georgenia soli]|uniref:Glycerate kinase n=1 Tax=Georgenia soli TaxID=638953 RepID=A0A2A9ELF4_9MICO|nr:glycerate kinase [Georgenia soli]PFG39049.1 glycerate kinase [Georgenia soli]
MRIVCAPDSFKESMTAAEAAAAMARGIRRVLPGADVVEVPLADGGEGTCATLVEVLGGELVHVPCTDALGRPSTGTVGWVADRALAVIEVASACGLEQVPAELRDARTTTSFGAGELVTAALDLGARHLVIGLGGSATNDAGTGMLQALGVRFLDEQGLELRPGGADLARLARVDDSGLRINLADVEILLACDVTNPLLGPDGASKVFGPQKGATPQAVEELDGALTRWADVVEKARGVSVRDVPGAGAAGGLGAAFLAFTGARIRPGIEVVMDAVGLARLVGSADLIFTGEGSMDAQSAAGKVPWGVAQLALEVGVPVVVFAGHVDDAVDAAMPPGVRAIVPIVRGVSDLPHALAEGPTNLERAAALASRLITATVDRPGAVGTRSKEFS